MRKSILLIFALLFVLAGCQLFSEKKGFEITNLSLSQEEGVTFQIKVHKLEISENDIISYGVVIVKEKVNEIEDLTFDKKDSFLESENLSFFLQIDEENYQTDYSLRAYVKYLDGEEEKYLYSESFEVFNLYSLAKESNNDFAKKVVRIVEEEKITEVKIEIDFENNTITTSMDSVEVSLNEDEENLIIEVSVKEGYYLDESLVFIVNDETIEQEQYTFDDITINYTFAKPNPEEFVFVEVTFDLDGGVWTKNILNDMTPDQSLVVTTKDDIGGKTFTILDDKATAYRYFYKIFLKLDEKTDLYQVVAVDNARGHIINLDLPEYNYVLAVHDDCNDKDALNVIKNYIKSNDDNLYVLFDKDPYSFENNLKVNFYKEDSVFGVYNITLFDEVDLPIPYRHEFNFIGWSDGENIYTTFPRYQLKDGITKVTYKAVWESFSLDDFKNLINSILPKEIESDVELPTSFSNYTISWSSSHEDVVTNMGKFTKPYKDTKVTLIATLKSKNGEEKQMSFEVFAKGYKELKNGIASSYIYRNYNLVTDEFFETLDIINCAFITADSAGRLSGSNFLSNVKNYILPKARENGNWVIMSVAPNPDTKWSKIAANPATVEAFANNIVKVINEYGFDGVDIDWETPTSSEAKLFTALMKVVYQKVKANNPNHLVTAAIAGGMWQPPRYDLINSQKYIDYINMMTYGMVSSNGQYQNALYRSTSSHNTKFGVGKTLTSCSIHESIEIYNNDFNIPNHKIIVGVAFYGLKQTYTNGAWKGAGSVFYTNIKKSYINNSLYTEYYDEKAEVPYILKNDGTEFISYDNPRSVLAKCEYVLDNGLGGIMYWENGCDSTGDLLAAMKLGLNK